MFVGISVINDGSTRQRITPKAIKNLDLLIDHLPYIIFIFFLL